MTEGTENITAPPLKGAKEYGQVFDQNELDNIYRTILSEVHQQRTPVPSSTAERRGRALPLTIIALSIVLAFGGGYVLFDSFAERAIFSRLFPGVIPNEQLASSRLPDEIVRKIQEDATQQVINLQIELYNQQRALEFALQDDSTLAVVDNDNDETPEDVVEDIAAKIEVLKQEVEEQTALLPETPTIELAEYNLLLIQQERVNSLLDSYLNITNDIRNAIETQNVAAVQENAQQLRSFLEVFSSSESEVLRTLAQSGRNFLDTVDRYLSAVSTNRDEVAAEEAQQEAQQQIEEAQQQAQEAQQQAQQARQQVQELTQALTSQERETIGANVRRVICEDELEVCKRGIN